MVFIKKINNPAQNDPRRNPLKIHLTLYPNPDKPELKIEDCKLNIYGCRFAPSLLKSTGYLSFSPPPAD